MAFLRGSNIPLELQLSVWWGGWGENQSRKCSSSLQMWVITTTAKNMLEILQNASGAKKCRATNSTHQSTEESYCLPEEPSSDSCTTSPNLMKIVYEWGPVDTCICIIWSPSLEDWWTCMCGWDHHKPETPNGMGNWVLTCTLSSGITLTLHTSSHFFLRLVQLFSSSWLHDFFPTNCWRFFFFFFFRAWCFLTSFRFIYLFI